MVPRFSLLTIVHELIDTPEHGIMIVLFFLPQKLVRLFPSREVKPSPLPIAK